MSYSKSAKLEAGYFGIRMAMHWSNEIRPSMLSGYIVAIDVDSCVFVAVGDVPEPQVLPSAAGGVPFSREASAHRGCWRGTGPHPREHPGEELRQERVHVQGETLVGVTLLNNRKPTELKTARY